MDQTNVSFAAQELRDGGYCGVVVITHHMGDHVNDQKRYAPGTYPTADEAREAAYQWAQAGFPEAE